MRIREKLAHIVLGGVLVTIIQISILQSSISFLPLSLAESYSGWTQEQFADWYQRFTKARDEVRGTTLSGVDFAKFRAELQAKRKMKGGIDLYGADFSGANLRKADLEGVILLNTNLMAVDLQEANLQEAGLRGASLMDANLKGANLQRANLQSADLQLANLQGANLQVAHLLWANLKKANLQGANLSGTELKETKLEGAIYDDTTKFPEGFDPFKAGMIMFGLIDPLRPLPSEKTELDKIIKKIKNK